MGDSDVAKVTAVHRLEDSPLTLERSRPEISRTVGAPCSVVQVSYRIHVPALPINLDDALVSLKAAGIRLGQEAAPRAAPREPAQPYGPAEFIVATSGQRFVAPVADRWELSVPVVIMLLYVQTTVEQVAHLVGEQVEIRRLTAGMPERNATADGGRDP